MAACGVTGSGFRIFLGKQLLRNSVNKMIQPLHSFDALHVAWFSLLHDYWNRAGIVRVLRHVLIVVANTRGLVVRAVVQNLRRKYDFVEGWSMMLARAMNEDRNRDRLRLTPNCIAATLTSCWEKKVTRSVEVESCRVEFKLVLGDQAFTVHLTRMFKLRLDDPAPAFSSNNANAGCFKFQNMGD
ncbi:hypothetical protein SADUNF_Sadunf08G0036200 [Salix dunnii]|uniref:Uncharacterized protein n=1 Tax=Salix dunnii TaxID=1413687 RepID=A0A835JX83_9ROSI|nr:hypothetical protein SADUNF_Sadunf08G0036200 [Salix dunnii]